MPVPHPRPAYRPETPLIELGTAELFVTSTLRLWVLPHTEPGGDHPDWRGGFLGAGIGTEGAVAFDTLLRIVATAASRHLEVHCLHCPRLAGDEGWMLQLLGLMQRDRIVEGVAILEQWLPPAAVRMALPSAHVFAQALEERGLTLPYLVHGSTQERWRAAACESILVH